MSRSAAAITVGLVFLLAAAVVDFAAGLQLAGVYATAAIITAVSGRPRPTAAVAAAALAAAVVSGIGHDTTDQPAWAVRVASCLVAGVAAVVAARLADQYLERVRHTTRLAQDLLDALAVELTGVRTVPEVADAFLGQAVERLGASSAMVFLLDDDEVLRSVSWLGRGGPQADKFLEVPLEADLAGASAVRLRTALHFPDRESIYEAFPDLEGYYPEERSLHLLPLLDGDVARGLLALTFPPRVVETEDERRLLVSLTAALSTALARAQDLAHADAEVRRSGILSDASRTLSRSLDWDETLDEVSRLLVPGLADWCALHLLEEGVLDTTAVWHRDPETSAWAQTMRGVFPIDMDAPMGAPAVVRSGEPELYPSIPDELLIASAINEEHALVLQRLGLVSALVAPLRARGEITGAISLAYAESGRQYSEADVHLLVDLAARVGTALENARSFARQTRRLTEVTKVAAVAQRAILAPPPSEIGPLILAALYVSAAEEAQVGGDLYEVVTRDDRVRVLIGDVRGKGLSAVRTATIVLGGFRSLSGQDIAVDELARQLDHHVQTYLDDEEDFVTAALVDIERDGQFSLVLCGHPAPVLTHHGRWRRADAPPTAPLGLGSDPAPTHGRLEPGDRLLLYTDGLLEARRPDGEFIDPEPLWELTASRPFSGLLESLLGSLQDWTGGSLQDDLALLSIQFQQDVSADDPVRVARVLPAEGASVGEARRMLRELVGGTGMDPLLDDAQLALSEVVTNALVHAGGDIHLTLLASQSGLRVEVGDQSPHLPVQRDYHATSATGRGLHMVDNVVDRWGSFPLAAGKVVWFELGLPGDTSFAASADPVPSSDRRDADVEVRLLDVPLLMHMAWQEHAAGLLREYLLVRLDEDLEILGAHAQASDALSILFEQLPAPDLGEDPDAVTTSAVEPLVTLPSVTLRLAPESVDHFALLDSMVHDALTLAEDGQLLVPPTQHEIREMSRWICEQVQQQAREGADPRPWRSPRPPRVTDPRALVVEGFDAEEVSGSGRSLLATDEASVIVAVSESAAHFLGYPSARDMLGLPIVTIVPARFHQAHVAGTTLHAINGRDPLLGLRVTVPVVRADGTETPVTLQVDPRPLPTGRRVFVAELFVDDAGARSAG